MNNDNSAPKTFDAEWENVEQNKFVRTLSVKNQILNLVKCFNNNTTSNNNKRKQWLSAWQVDLLQSQHNARHYTQLSIVRSMKQILTSNNFKIH